jgi:hypothetical protein
MSSWKRNLRILINIVSRKKLGNRIVLVVYSGPDEQHEMGVSLSSGTTLPTSVLGAGVNAAVVNGVTILSWRTTAADRALRLGPLYIYFIGIAVTFPATRERLTLSRSRICLPALDFGCSS